MLGCMSGGQLVLTRSACVQIGQPMLPLDHDLFNFGSWYVLYFVNSTRSPACAAGCMLLQYCSGL